MDWDSPFEIFPELETKRLKLRKIVLSDAPSIYDYFSKKEVTQFYDLETFTSKQQAIELIESLLYRYQVRKQIRWGITWKGNDKLIGTCGLHALEKEHLKAEIGYELHPDYWGKGIITEVIQAIIHYGFFSMGINRIEAFYDPLNIPSKRVLEKNGFQYEGTLRNRFYTKGKFIDVALSSIIKENLS